MEKLSTVAKTFTPSPIQQFSLLAESCNAINLAEGFPDFPAPDLFKNAAVAAISSDFNQYRHVQGLCDLLASKMKELYGLLFDPLAEIVICCGQTEAFAASIFSVIDRGDEVVLFDPSYETYDACIRMAGGVPVYVQLDPPAWTLDPDKFINSFSSRTKAVVLNSPQNPTGKVFSSTELEIIAGACRRWDCLAITDEVYEHITYDNVKHIPLASYPGMQDRTIITSSLSKTFSITGWRVGWAIASVVIASAIRNIHVKLTDSAPAPFQESALTILRSPKEYYESLRRDYESKRDFVINMLEEIGFHVQFKPQGSFFLFVEIPENSTMSDVEYVKELIEQAGVVAVPGRGFFHAKSSCEGTSQIFAYQKRYIRFAFCKSNTTLTSAAQRLGKLLRNQACSKLHLVARTENASCK